MGHSHVAQGTARCQHCIEQCGVRGLEPAGPGSIQTFCLDQASVLGSLGRDTEHRKMLWPPHHKQGFPAVAQMWVEHQPRSSPYRAVGHRQHLAPSSPLTGVIQVLYSMKRGQGFCRGGFTSLLHDMRWFQGAAATLMACTNRFQVLRLISAHQADPAWPYQPLSAGEFSTPHRCDMQVQGMQLTCQEGRCSAVCSTAVPLTAQGR